MARKDLEEISNLNDKTPHTPVCLPKAMFKVRKRTLPRDLYRLVLSKLEGSIFLVIYVSQL
jgi:hypothetical protein